MRKAKTRKTSIKGISKKPNAIAGVEYPVRFTCIAGFSTNFIASMLQISPIKVEPESPIKIFAGGKLYMRNASSAPAIEKAKTAYGNTLFIKKNTPKKRQATRPMEAARPS